LIRQANSVPLINILNFYKVPITPGINKIICPFKSHKNGKERTPSFNFYAHTNSFNCFGCKTGGSCCEFVSTMDNISKEQAASKIMKLFQGSVNGVALRPVVDTREALRISMELSDVVREFRQSFKDEKSIIFIEDLCRIYDDLYSRHNNKHKVMSNEALQSIVDQCKERIEQYKSCLIL